MADEIERHLIEFIHFAKKSMSAYDDVYKSSWHITYSSNFTNPKGNISNVAIITLEDSNIRPHMAQETKSIDGAINAARSFWKMLVDMGFNVHYHSNNRDIGYEEINYHPEYIEILQ